MSKQELDLIEEKFKGLTSLMNAHFENVDDRLGRIEEQTKKTNGRVTELEHKELTHILNCPQTSKIEAINKELEDYRFILKHPKLIIAGIILLIILAGATFFSSIDNKVMLKKEEPKTEVHK